jgi:diguanylate cyclase (GGDEF)-like protein
MGSKNQTILIIEDTSTDDELFRSILGKDYQLLFATGRKDVLEINDHHFIDLVLLDTDTFGINAVEINSHLSANPANRNTQIILMVKKAQEGILGDLPAGVADFITKPLQPPIVITRLKYHLELKWYRDFWESISTDSYRMEANRQWKFDFLMAREWQRALRNQTPLSLVLIDIDFFKEFEAHKGRPAGDQVLWLVGEVLRDCGKRGLDFIARHATHAYVCLLPDTDADGAQRVCQFIHEKMAQLNIPHPCSPISDHVTLSLGVATVRPTFKLDQDHLIHQAEVLLEEARNCRHAQAGSWKS